MKYFYEIKFDELDNFLDQLAVNPRSNLLKKNSAEQRATTTTLTAARAFL